MDEGKIQVPAVKQHIKTEPLEVDLHTEIDSDANSNWMSYGFKKEFKVKLRNSNVSANLDKSVNKDSKQVRSSHMVKIGNYKDFYKYISARKSSKCLPKDKVVDKDKIQVPAFKPYIKPESLEVDLHTDINLDVDSNCMGYDLKKEFQVEETENCNSSADLGKSTELPNEDSKEMRNFHIVKTENYDDSYKNYSDSVVSYTRNSTEVKDFCTETRNCNDANEVFIESKESLEGALVDTKQLKLEHSTYGNDAFQTDSKLSRLPDSNISPEAATVTLFGQVASKCETCNNIFKTKKGFENHPCRNNLSHNSDQNEPLYICINCEAALPNIFEYNNHMQQSHGGGELGVKCGVCGLVMKRANYLKMHLMMHFRIKMYKCSSCEECFTMRDSLKQHMRSHNEEQPIKLKMITVQCSKCKRTFENSRFFRQHICKHVSSYQM